MTTERFVCTLHVLQLEQHGPEHAIPDMYTCVPAGCRDCSTPPTRLSLAVGIKDYCCWVRTCASSSPRCASCTAEMMGGCCRLMSAWTTVLGRSCIIHKPHSLHVAMMLTHGHHRHREPSIQLVSGPRGLCRGLRPESNSTAVSAP